MSIQSLSDSLATAGVKHIVVAAYGLPSSITQKQLSGFKMAMIDQWTANESYLTSKFGIEAPMFYMLKDMAEQLYGTQVSGWRVLKLSEVNKALDGAKVQSTYYVPSEHVKKLFSK